MKVKVTRISKKDTDKDGVKLLGKKDGKPYWKIGIQTEQTGDEWLSGFANSTTDPRYLMEEGGEYSIAIQENHVGDKIYKNFRMLKPDELKMEEMEEELKKLKAEKTASSTVQGQAESHITIDDIETDIDKF